MFPKGLEMQHWTRLGSFIFLVQVVLILSELVHFMSSLLIFKFKVVFHKNLKVGSCNIFFTSNLLSPQICLFISCYGNCKQYFLFTMTTITQGGKPLLSLSIHEVLSQTDYSFQR